MGWYEECPVCHRYGFTCAACHIVASRALDTLASNLATAGGLCEAFDLGWFAKSHQACEFDCKFQWHPGCYRHSDTER